MKTIPLTKGKVAQIDDEDFDKVSSFEWRCEIDSYGNEYAVTGNQRGLFRHFMHHLILLNRPSEVHQVDHKDRNGLNNQKENLRWATAAQNSYNRGPSSTNKCGYKGVCWLPKQQRWRAMIKAHGKNHYLGLFGTAEEAAKVYNEYARNLHGEFAYQNTLPS